MLREMTEEHEEKLQSVDKSRW